MSLEFLLTSLLVIVVPGTGVLYTLAIGLNHGFRTSVSAAFGCTLGIIPAATTVILGLSAIFNTSALAFQVIRVFGVMYLFYIAWSVWNYSGTRDLEETPALENHLHIAVTGTLINVLNPKLLLFSGFFATISATNHRKYYPLSHRDGLNFYDHEICGVRFYGAFAASARQYVINRPNVIKGVKGLFAASFGLLGLRLAFAER